MASKQEVQQALDQLWAKYGNTLSMLSDAIDKLDAKDKEIERLNQLVADGEDIDITLDIPADILELEKSVLGKSESDEQG